jgi:hypothetical protein
MRAFAPFLLVALPALAAAPTGAAAAPPVGAVAAAHEDVDDADAEDGWQYPCDGTDPALLREIDEAFRTRIGYGETWDESICNQGTLVGGGTSAMRRRRVASPPSVAAAATGDANATGNAHTTGDATKAGAVGTATGVPGLDATSRGPPSSGAPAPAGLTGDPATATASTSVTGASSATAATTSTTGAPKKELTAWEKRVNDQFFALAIPLMTLVGGLFAVVVAALIGLFLRLRRQIVLDVGCPSCPTHFPFVVGESTQLFCPACGAPCRIDITGSGVGATAHAVAL